MNEYESDRQKTARKLYKCFRSMMTIVDAAKATGIPERTVNRYFRVFRLYSEGAGLDRICAEFTEWSPDTIRSVIDAICIEDPPELDHPDGEGEVEDAYLERHRLELLSLVDELGRLATSGTSISLREVLSTPGQGPPGPGLAGKFLSPQHQDPLVKCLADHLSDLGLPGLLADAGSARADCLKKASHLVEYVLNQRTTAVLDSSIEYSQIMSGVDAIRKPDTGLIEFGAKETEGTFRVSGGAYSQAFQDFSEAETAARWANQVRSVVTGSSQGRALVDAQNRLSHVLALLGRAVADRDLVNRILFHSTCERCAGQNPSLD